MAKYTSGTPLRMFQALYPDNHYSVEIDIFLKPHNYASIQRGADLPWWGSKFFTDEPGRRVMVIAQDSYYVDAGSIVFYAALFPYTSWNAMRRQLAAWNIKLEFCYITDAAKVYRNGSWADGDFDRKKSAELLHYEVEVCNPQVMILLGGAPLRLLRRDLDYATAVECGKLITIVLIQ